MGLRTDNFILKATCKWLLRNRKSMQECSTTLKDSNKSIDFLTRDNRIVPWVKNGNYSPDNSYRNGMIEGMPFNIDSSDFISIFEGEL
ncbi:hypothetical protein [Butyrivibrio sp. MB2005]|uniref:hypothetical protein n=1 Tax=Butyrivibrio sp. MB2005 TaxID=1280678 RepID=UPI0012DDA319|nr:hypothetical protein [Butyrivibrio sp. MB2005]